MQASTPATQNPKIRSFNDLAKCLQIAHTSDNNVFRKTAEQALEDFRCLPQAPAIIVHLLEQSLSAASGSAVGVSAAIYLNGCLKHSPKLYSTLIKSKILSFYELFGNQPAIRRQLDEMVLLVAKQSVPLHLNWPESIPHLIQYYLKNPNANLFALTIVGKLIVLDRMLLRDQVPTLQKELKYVTDQLVLRLTDLWKCVFDAKHLLYSVEPFINIWMDLFADHVQMDASMFTSLLKELAKVFANGSLSSLSVKAKLGMLVSYMFRYKAQIGNEFGTLIQAWLQTWLNLLIQQRSLDGDMLLSALFCVFTIQSVLPSLISPQHAPILLKQLILPIFVKIQRVRNEEDEEQEDEEEADEEEGQEDEEEDDCESGSLTHLMSDVKVLNMAESVLPLFDPSVIETVMFSGFAESKGNWKMFTEWVTFCNRIRFFPTDSSKKQSWKELVTFLCENVSSRLSQNDFGCWEILRLINFHEEQYLDPKLLAKHWPTWFQAIQDPNSPSSYLILKIMIDVLKRQPEKQLPKELLLPILQKIQKHAVVKGEIIHYHEKFLCALLFLISWHAEWSRPMLELVFYVFSVNSTSYLVRSTCLFVLSKLKNPAFLEIIVTFLIKVYQQDILSKVKDEDVLYKVVTMMYQLFPPNVMLRSFPVWLPESHFDHDHSNLKSAQVHMICKYIRLYPDPIFSDRSSIQALFKIVQRLGSKEEFPLMISLLHTLVDYCPNISVFWSTYGIPITAAWMKTISHQSRTTQIAFISFLCNAYSLHGQVIQLPPGEDAKLKDLLCNSILPNLVSWTSIDTFENVRLALSLLVIDLKTDLNMKTDVKTDPNMKTNLKTDLNMKTDLKTKETNAILSIVSCVEFKRKVWSEFTKIQDWTEILFRLHQHPWKVLQICSLEKAKEVIPRLLSRFS